MAHDAITVILMPELNAGSPANSHSLVDNGAIARLELTTRKGNHGLHSGASIYYATPESSCVFSSSDFRKTVAQDQGARATQKTIDTLHARTFTPERIAELQDAARAHYARERA